MNATCIGVAFIVAYLKCTDISEPPRVIDSFCARAEIIRPSRQDTDPTLHQIARHNAKVRRCNQKIAPTVQRAPVYSKAIPKRRAPRLWARQQK